MGLSFDLQLIPELMPRMAELIAQSPDTKIALCHAGSPYNRTEAGLQRWSKILAHLSDLSNVTCKLSGLGMFDHDWTADKIKPIVDTCIAQFGADRLMFGSNFPVDSLSGSYEKLIQAYEMLTAEAQQSKIFNSTAKRFYEL